MENGIVKNCTDLSYRFIVPAVEFGLDKFTEALGESAESDGWHAVYLGAKSPESFPFHAHVYWRPEPEDSTKLMLQVDYHRTVHDIPIDPKVIFAEDFFKWVGQFFVSSIVNFHLHVEFSYPMDMCQVKILPLPLKIPYEGKSASVDGVSISLPTAPEGVGTVWINLAKKQVGLELYADRRMEFKESQVQIDIGALMSVVNSLVEVKSE